MSVRAMGPLTGFEFVEIFIAKKRFKTEEARGCHSGDAYVLSPHSRCIEFARTSSKIRLEYQLIAGLAQL